MKNIFFFGLSCLGNIAFISMTKGMNWRIGYGNFLVNMCLYCSNCVFASQKLMIKYYSGLIFSRKGL